MVRFTIKEAEVEEMAIWKKRESVKIWLTDVPALWTLPSPFYCYKTGDFWDQQ